MGHHFGRGIVRLSWLEQFHHCALGKLGRDMLFGGCRTIDMVDSSTRYVKAAFTNYVDKILPNIDRLPTPCWHLWQNCYRGKFVYCWHFQYHLSTLSCHRSLWMTLLMINHVSLRILVTRGFFHFFLIYDVIKMNLYLNSLTLIR